ncbi:hypothetical protein TNCV_864931 [Trichonephila clavipes]|nr:hypothetical protein TNCV_864931 [Trichonephila clavipes]
MAMKLQKEREWLLGSMQGTRYSVERRCVCKCEEHNVIGDVSLHKMRVVGTCRRTYLDNFTRERMIGKLEEGHSLSSVTDTNKVLFCVLEKPSELYVQLLEKLMVGKPLQWMTNLLVKLKIHCSETGRQVDRRFHTSGLLTTALNAASVWKTPFRVIAPRDSQRQVTWFHSCNITEKHRYGCPGVAVLGGMLNGWNEFTFSTEVP